MFRKGRYNVEIDQGNKMNFWHVSNIKEERSAALYISSDKIQYDDMFLFEASIESFFLTEMLCVYSMVKMPFIMRNYIYIANKSFILAKLN